MVGRTTWPRRGSCEWKAPILENTRIFSKISSCQPSVPSFRCRKLGVEGAWVWRHTKYLVHEPAFCCYTKHPCKCPSWYPVSGPSKQELFKASTLVSSLWIELLDLTAGANLDLLDSCNWTAPLTRVRRPRFLYSTFSSLSYASFWCHMTVLGQKFLVLLLFSILLKHTSLLDERLPMSKFLGSNWSARTLPSWRLALKCWSVIELEQRSEELLSVSWSRELSVTPIILGLFLPRCLQLRTKVATGKTNQKAPEFVDVREQALQNSSRSLRGKWLETSLTGVVVI